MYILLASCSTTSTLLSTSLIAIAAWGSSSTNSSRRSLLRFSLSTCECDRLSSSGIKGGMEKYWWLNWLELTTLLSLHRPLAWHSFIFFFSSRMIASTIWPNSECSEYWNKVCFIYLGNLWSWWTDLLTLTNPGDMMRPLSVTQLCWTAGLAHINGCCFGNSGGSCILNVIWWVPTWNTTWYSTPGWISRTLLDKNKNKLWLHLSSLFYDTTGRNSVINLDIKFE